MPDPLVQTVLSKAQGNPFFLEEIAQTLVEQGMLRRDVGIALPHTIHLPPTVQAVLAARLDRLPPEEKRLLQTAAVIGTAVPLPLLQAIVDLPEATLHRALAHLQATEFLYETRLSPEPEYTFKHALTHEVAYGSLLLERRRELHVRTVEALEALAPDRVAEQVDRLAHHALRGELWEKAVTYSQQAGTRARDRAAFGEAAVAFEQALQALRHLPEHSDARGLAIELHLTLGGTLTQLGEYRRCLALMAETEVLARALDDRSLLGRVLAQMADGLRQTGDHDGAMAAGQQALTLAVALDDRALQIQTCHRLGQVYATSGNFGRAAELFRRSVEAGDREPGTPGTSARLHAQAWLAWTLGVLGEFAEGRRHGEEALHLATLESRGSTPIVVRTRLGHLYLTQGDLEPAIGVLKQGLALCRASGDRNSLRLILAGLGYAAALQGRLTEGRALLEEASSESLRTGARNPRWLAWLSEVCRLSGPGEEAWQYARQALDLARQRKARGEEALALCQLGVVQAHADPPDVAQAEACYQQALALAEALGMRPLQAHGHFGLGTLYVKMGQWEQARAELSTAIQLYSGMEMTFWPPRAEQVLAQVGRAGID
jgi:tetratricopeptide (TPR) repeat protein